MGSLDCSQRINSKVKATSAAIARAIVRRVNPITPKVCLCANKGTNDCDDKGSLQTLRSSRLANSKCLFSQNGGRSEAKKSVDGGTTSSCTRRWRCESARPEAQPVNAAPSRRVKRSADRQKNHEVSALKHKRSKSTDAPFALK